MRWPLTIAVRPQQRQTLAQNLAAIDARLARPRAAPDCGASLLHPALVAPGDDAHVSFARTLGEDDRDACFEILEENMREQYDANPWGWNAAVKRSELAHDNARFVLVRGGGGKIQAFAHFRFDPDDEVHASRAVVYVWELQVAKPFQGAGLGRRVMACCSASPNSSSSTASC